MKLNELFPNTFKALAHRSGPDKSSDSRPLWQQRLSTDSDFCHAVVAAGYLTTEQMQHAAVNYRLGRSRRGGVIFWQIDEHEVLCDGKIMYYRKDCHRDHHRHPDWVSSCLKRYYLKDDEKLASEIKTCHCLFGLHQLCAQQKPVAVVEAEKTAVILSEHFPDFLWLATGGLFELSAAKLLPLRGRKILLFPDTDSEGKAYAVWYQVTQEAQRLLRQPIHLSPLLELHATPAQKERKIDLTDYLWEQSSPTEGVG